MMLKRAAGRYTLENDEHIDVLVARFVPVVGGGFVVEFKALWESSQKTWKTFASSRRCGRSANDDAPDGGTRP